MLDIPFAGIRGIQPEWQVASPIGAALCAGSVIAGALLTILFGHPATRSS